MVRIFALFFIILLVFPITASATGPNKYLLEKEKLICLFEQVDNLLEESKNKLVNVYLTDQLCNQYTKNDDDTRSSLPVIDINIDPSKPTLSPKKRLTLTHKQLQCFKQVFKTLINDERDPVPVDFENICRWQERN